MAIVDGESEDDQTKAVTNNVIYQRIAELLNLPIQQCATSIHTQEFFDSAGNLETIWMYLDIWKLNARKPETIWIAPKDPVSDPKSFKEGQEKAKQILDILIVQNIKQDKEYVTHLLQTNVTKFSHKI